MPASEQTARKGYGTTQQVAEHIGFSPVTLRKWRWQRTGPPFTGSGSGVRYAWADVEAWMRDRPTTKHS